MLGSIAKNWVLSQRQLLDLALLNNNMRQLRNHKNTSKNISQ